MACSLGAVLWNAIGRSNTSVLKCTDLIFFFCLENVVIIVTFLRILFLMFQTHK